MNLPAKQKQRHRERTNVWTPTGKRGWEELGDRDWHICITMYKSVSENLPYSTVLLNCGVGGDS